MFGSNGCDTIFASRLIKTGKFFKKVMLKNVRSERKVLLETDV